MKTIGATLTRVSPGEVTIELPFSSKHTQQNGYLHAGVITSIADSACGYAVMSLAPPGSEVLTVEFKVNFLEPAFGSMAVAEARVLKDGRTIGVCACDVFMKKGKRKSLVATMIATIFKRKS